MKINVNKKELITAVEKASISCKDTFVIVVNSKKNKSADNTEGDNSVLVTVLACNGNTQSAATISAKADSIGTFIVGVELYDALKAVGEFGDEFTIDVSDKIAEISSGNATMPLGLKKDAIKVDMQSPKKEKSYLQATIEREAFVKAVRQGSFAYGSASCDVNLINTVAIHPQIDDKLLYFLSSDGRLATRSKVVAMDLNNKLENDSDTLYISLDAPTLRSICTKLGGDNIEIFIFSKQISIKDENDYYTLTRYQTVFPKVVGDLLDLNEYDYKADFDVSSLKAALKVATVLEDKKKALITIKNGEVTISSVQGKNTALVKAENVEGEISIIVNEKHFEMVIADLAADKLTVLGLGSGKPIYIVSDSIKALTAPVKND